MSSATERPRAATPTAVATTRAVPAATRPIPKPSRITAPYWQAAASGCLHIQRCTQCGVWSHPPRLICGVCGNGEMVFAPVSGRGTIVQYIVVHQTKQTGFEHCVPYGAAAVELDEQPGLVVVGNIVDSPSDSVAVGNRVVVDFEPLTDGMALPQFRLSNTAEPPWSEVSGERA